MKRVLTADTKPDTMNVQGKGIAVAGILGGIVLLIVTFASDALVQMIAPYDLFALGGMRATTDPLMMLYFLYSFIFAVIVALFWALAKGSFTGSEIRKSFCFGGILFLLVVIPNSFVIFSTMDYPAGFHLSNILTGIIAYPVLGYLNVRFNQ